MRRAVSIHIGVNQPGRSQCKRPLLAHSEDAAWRMAVLASQAGYESLQVLRGRAATRLAVHEALAGAAGLLQADDNLLVTFSGHGVRLSATGDKEVTDESWCLFDGEMTDNKLIGYLRLFEEGVRIVVVSESCFSGGMTRTGHAPAAGQDPPAVPEVRMRDGGLSAQTARARGYDGEGFADPARRTRGGPDPCDEVLRLADHPGSGERPADEPPTDTGGSGTGGTCITKPVLDPLAIRAKVLMLTAAGESEEATDGVFTCALLRLWDDGAFKGTYCDLYGSVRKQVMTATNGKHEPQILLGGSACPNFPLQPAFHLARDRRVYGLINYRGEHEECSGGQATPDGAPITRGGEPNMRGEDSSTRGGEPNMRGGDSSMRGGEPTTRGGEPITRGGEQMTRGGQTTRGGEPGMRGG
ncbi:MAG TPA: caspase family protein [Longimicrobium sp.]|nr:caspase family protein [Longimicrobium sp.]